MEWHRHDARISEDTRTHIETRDNRTQITIRNVVRGDTGKFSITLTNEAGQETAVIRVNVIGMKKVIFIIYFAKCIWSSNYTTPKYTLKKTILKYYSKVKNSRDDNESEISGEVTIIEITLTESDNSL